MFRQGENHMRSKSFLAMMLMVFSVSWAPAPAAAAEGITLTITVMSADGKVISTTKATAEEVLSAFDTPLFGDIRDAVREIVRDIEAQQQGAAAQASREMSTSPKTKINILGIGTGSSTGGGGGGGGCTGGVASCN
ncbi:MAG: hypothetical protein Q8J78_15555 [Moraxellaceae bacterium]|nr:hypothetical protein [Moraxellaceae bacterium]